MQYITPKLYFFALLGCVICSASGKEAMTLKQAMTEGTPSAELRLGYEYSSTNDTTSPANAANVRLRLGYHSASYFDTGVFLQFHGMININENFRFPGGGKSRRDVIADPDGERLHQGYVEYNGWSTTRLRLGRQEIILDDSRLIGNIGWRQNGQSFDGVSLVNNSISDTTITIGFVNRVNTIFLTHVDLDHLILFNFEYLNQNRHRLAIYSYLLDTEQQTAAARDSVTYGIRSSGTFSDFVDYDLTYATQNDYRDGKNRNGDLFNVYIGGHFDLLSLGIGYSRISGQKGSDRPFDTLFSTAHKFNGWADQFAGTNGGSLTGGLEDLYFQVSKEILGTKFLIRYHIFDTVERTIIGADSATDKDDNHSGRYGDEIDFEVLRKLTDYLTVRIKYSYYNEVDGTRNDVSNPTTDKNVFWARLAYNF